MIDQALVAAVTQEVLRQTNQVAAPVPVREATGNIACVHCGRVVMKGDKNPDHINGCEHPTGMHLYRTIFKSDEE